MPLSSHRRFEAALAHAAETVERTMDRLIPKGDARGGARLRRHALFEPGRRQAAARVLRAGRCDLVQGRRVAGAADRQRHRIRARLFADPRRSAGDGRRRSAARQAVLPQAIRRGDGHTRRRRPAGAGLRGAGARGHARRSGGARPRWSPNWPRRRARRAWSAARCSTCWPKARAPTCRSAPSRACSG